MGFNLGFNIRNPFFKGGDTFKELFSYNKKLTKNKFLEVNADKSSTSDFIEFNFRGCLKGQDHAGIELSGRIGNIYASIELRDSRHWDYEHNKWMVDLNSWFKEFQKYITDINEGAVIHENNVIEYYNDQLTPLEAVEPCINGNGGIDSFLAPSSKCIIPGRFIRTEVTESDVDVIVHVNALKYFQSNMIDVTKNGNPVRVRFLNFTITNNDLYSDYIGDCTKYENYVELDRKYIASFDMVINPETFTPIVGVTLTRDAPLFDDNEIVSSDVGHLPIKIRRGTSDRSAETYVPKFYYKV